MSLVGGMYAFSFEPMKTSVARYAGFMFGSERRPPREKICSTLPSCDSFPTRRPESRQNRRWPSCWLASLAAAAAAQRASAALSCGLCLSVASSGRGDRPDLFTQYLSVKASRAYPPGRPPLSPSPSKLLLEYYSSKLLLKVPY